MLIKIFGRRQLRHLVLYPKLQLTFILYTLVISLFIIGVFYAAYIYVVTTHIMSGLVDESVYNTLISEQRKIMKDVLLTTSIVTVLLVPFFGFLFSHKIVGPVYRLREHMRTVANDFKYQQLSFRKGDFFQDLLEPYNKILSKLKK